MSDWLWRTVGSTTPKAFRIRRPLLPRARVMPVSIPGARNARRVGLERARATSVPVAEARRAVLRPGKPPGSIWVRAGLAALYRLTRHQLFPTFFSPGSLESRALMFLSEPDRKESQRILVGLAPGVLTESHESLYRVLCSANEGRVPRRFAWSSHPCADALRVRHLKRRPSFGEASRMTWYGALRWVGRRALDRDDLADGPENSRKCVALAVASAAGYRRAVELLPAWFPDGPSAKPSTKRWCSLLVMRAAIEEKRFTPETVPYLVPAVTAKLRPNDCVPLAAAFRSAVQERHEGGAVFFLAAIMTTAFRCALTNAAEETADCARHLPTWGRGAIGAEQMSVLSASLARLADATWNPWQEPVARRLQDIVRFDLEAIEQRLVALLGDARPPAFWFAFLDDAVLNASLFTLFGNTVSARIHLQRSQTPGSRGLQYRLESISRSGGDPESVWSLLERSIRGRADTVADLLRTPDPVVALGTPIWALNEGLGKIAPLALKEGRMRELSAVRALFHRQELRDRLAPFWILRKNELRSVLDALVWVGSGEPYPSEREWLEFLEVLAEEASHQC
ncbi:MAG TPA: hypothetical protein VLK65_24715 [Vicinamibacteria bacterium]|nr:hypothetical protein [Vicinamibacteria bacterium]